jgi:coproporphyrinogen III oxidase-like Fe-S oxidoreductase
VSGVSNREETRREGLRNELRRRMTRPQRHRLLQGYPMAPLMRPAPKGADPLRDVELDPTRPLIVGVLPHTFCNPKVRGCGFCTFPHEKFAHEPMRRVVQQVAREIEQTTIREPSLRERKVESVYLGGGTANLTPPEELQRLCAVLGSVFDLSGSELTLEGVPKYFLLRDESLLEVLARTNVRHRRISMGVQTFDAEWLRRMGRDSFGDRDDLQRVVESAHRRGFTASADLLFNLPGASLDHALADVRSAIEIGFDQVCTYNLVLTADLDTEWARDRALVRAMPDMTKACATWLAVRETLLERGYVQTTLTNFERADIAQTPRRFIYELASFDPATRDGIGFGPGAISTFTSRDRQKAVKWMNMATSEAFARSMGEHKIAVAATFDYAATDLRLLHLTRSLAGLAIDCAQYERFFGTDPVSDFPWCFQLLEDAGLVRSNGRALELTPEGMFYADAVAGLIAHRRVAELREETDDHAATHQHMG